MPDYPTTTRARAALACASMLIDRLDDPPEYGDVDPTDKRGRFRAMVAAMEAIAANRAVPPDVFHRLRQACPGFDDALRGAFVDQFLALARVNPMEFAATCRDLDDQWREGMAAMEAKMAEWRLPSRATAPSKSARGRWEVYAEVDDPCDDDDEFGDRMESPEEIEPEDPAMEAHERQSQRDPHAIHP